MSTALPAVPAARRGLLAGGNFIVDAVITVDRFPEQEMLANIEAETRTNGGGPYNVLCDLHGMQAPFPLGAVCLVGDDADGRWVRADCVSRGIDAAQIHVGAGLSTSHTYVVSVRATGRRTFFHHRGANAALDAGHFDFGATRARLFHLGYLMLLDRLDEVGADGSTGAARVLQAARAAGLDTSVDLVSVEHPDFRRVVRAALPHIDHLILNEIEAGRVLGRALSPLDVQALTTAAQELLAAGVGRAVAVHTEAGGVIATREGTASQGAVTLPAAFCRGTNGAGDAFAAGYLYGTHEDWPVPARLELAVCAAAASLSDPSPSAGLRPADECLRLGREHGYRRWR